jgi:peptide/nickel transport system substrate-binding protein/microcin C transport system substrate-binding protein
MRDRTKQAPKLRDREAATDEASIIREPSTKRPLVLTSTMRTTLPIRLATPCMRASGVFVVAALAFVAAGSMRAGAAPPPAATAKQQAVADIANGEAPAGEWKHAFATYGEPKHPKGFAHFDYANPDAPKGGTLYLSNPDRRTSFDKFNPYTIKGQSPAGLTILMFETLAVPGADEPATIYGLIAEEMLVAPDKSSITFRINPKARFNNGDPVTADDVKYAFDMLTSAQAAPIQRSRLAGTRSATVLDARTVRFDLKEKSADAIFNLGTRLPVFSRKWAPAADGQPKPFDQIINEYPIVTGPYRIAKTDSARRIDFELRPDYWARDLPVRRGFFNFDRIVYRYYQDGAVAIEAFKAGEFDLLQEYSARRWVRQHIGAKWRDERIRKATFKNGFGQGLQAYFLNTRRPVFAERLVRAAMIYSFDFEQVNVYKLYTRTSSLFSNSEFAATGTPSPGELALLEPFRAQVPPEVFGPAYVSPRTDASPNAVRENLLKARTLLETAGWKIAADGKLRNAAGQAMEFEYLDDTGRAGRFESSWRRNLEKLGITLKRREVDYSIMTKRIETKDFDVTQIRTTNFTLPRIGELRDLYSSKTADAPGSNNYPGVKNPVVDHLLDVMGNATTLEALRDAARALDRVIMWNHYFIPDLFSGSYRVSHWDKFAMPKNLPTYYTIDSALDIWPAWAVTLWWIK